MIIGLTGASGFLGRHLLGTAAAAGHSIVAFSRRAGMVLPGASEVRLWPTEGLPDFAGCDAVIHLAGEPVLGRWTPAKRALIQSSRTDGTRRVVAGLEATGPRPRVLVCASAIGYYGDRGDEWLDETSAPGTDFLAEVVQAWEREAAEAGKVGARVACARIGLVFGPDGGPWPLLRRVFGLGLGGRLGSGRQWMSWVHVDDVVALLLRAVADERFTGPFNVVSPEPVTNAAMTRAVAKALHRPAVLPVPAAVMRAVLRDQALMFLGGQRVRPAVVLGAGHSFRHPDLAEALQVLTQKKPRLP